MGVEKGESYLNVNRNEKELGPKAGTYGFRVNGPTDRSLQLVRFDDEEGKTIALLYNFAVHACMMIHNQPGGPGTGTEISGDMPGAACRILEKAQNDEPVVIFTSGAAGDLNPIMMSRVNIVEPNGDITVKELGAAGPIILEFMGNRFARDIDTVNRKLCCTEDEAYIWADKRDFELSSKLLGAPGPERMVTFRIGYIVIGDTCLISTNGEIFNEIGRRIKEASPFKNTLFITHAGNHVGYIKDDSGNGAYELNAQAITRAMQDDYCASLEK